MSVARVSVVIPVYNREAYVEATLRSVLSQNYRDLEIIVVDDGSTDRSRATVDAFAARDSRIRVIGQPNSGRPAVARNAGIRESRGAYVAFLDSDDLWLPGKLSAQMAVLEARPEVGMVYSWAMRFDGVRELGQLGPKRGGMPERIFEALLLEQCFILLSTVVLRRDALDRVGLFNEASDYRAVEDFDFVLRVAREYPAVFIPEVTARYRVHAANISADGHYMASRARRVIEDNCARFAVEPELRRRAVARAFIMELKVRLETGDSKRAVRTCIENALAHDPKNRVGRAAQAMLDMGLLPLMQLAYKNRRHATRLRDRINRSRLRRIVSALPATWATGKVARGGEGRRRGG